MSYDASRWKRGKRHVITNGDVSFCCRPSWLLSLLVTSLMCLQLSTVMHVSLPRQGELSYHKIPNNSRDVYLGSGGDPQAFNSFLSKIWDENFTYFASFSANSLASFCKWSCCGEGNVSANQHSRQTPHLCCHSRWRTFVSPSPLSSCGTLSWRAHLLITHPHMFISSSSLAFFLPPPGSLSCCCPPRTDAEAQFYFFANLLLSWGWQRNV